MSELSATALPFIEWAAFGGVLGATWLYGQKGRIGPAVGALSAAVFVLYGLMADLPAATVTNVIFFGIHCRNFIKLGAHRD